MKVLGIIGSVLMGSSAFAGSVTISNAKVEFLAIGKPSAIKIRGKGDNIESKLQIAGKNLTGQFVFDLSKLDTGIETRNEHMKEKYLETGKFKNAELTLKSLELAQNICKEDAKITKSPFEGTLKLHGVEKPVKGEFDVTSSKGSGHSQVRFSIAITDFNIDIPTYMGIKVTDKVENTIELVWSCKE